MFRPRRGELRRVDERIVAANAEGSFESAMDATMALLGFAGELIERKKVEPGEDFVTDLVEVGEDSCRPAGSSASCSRWSPGAMTR